MTELVIQLQWGDTRELADGRTVRSAAPTPEFWEVWRSRKAAVKAAGYGVSKYEGAWQVSEWTRPDAAEVEARVEASRATDAAIDIPSPDGLDYLPFQRAGISYALGRDATLFGDEMGLGKTIQAIGVMNALTEIKRVLVVCPASLRINWKNELNAWLTRPMEIGIAISNDLPDTDILVINFDILSRHVDALTSRHYDLLIVDEAHYIKNEKTKRYKAVKAVADSIKRKMFLTGTPIPNRPKEGFAIFNLLAPSLFPKCFPYALRYCAASKHRFGWDLDGASNLDELQSKLRESFMIRRLKKERGLG